MQPLFTELLVELLVNASGIFNYVHLVERNVECNVENDEIEWQLPSKQVESCQPSALLVFQEWICVLMKSFRRLMLMVASQFLVNLEADINKGAVEGNSNISFS